MKTDFLNLKWLRIDEFEESVHSLELSVELFNGLTLNSDYYQWVWVLITLHNALQGFMVLALRGTNGLNVLKPKCAQAWLEAYDKKMEYPIPVLDTFSNLYKKIKSDNMDLYFDSKRFKPMRTQETSIKQLNRFRNEFIHFIPANMSIEISGFPNILKECMEIIEFLAFESNNIQWQIHDHEDLENKTRKLITKAKSILINF